MIEALSVKLKGGRPKVSVESEEQQQIDDDCHEQELSDGWAEPFSQNAKSTDENRLDDTSQKGVDDQEEVDGEDSLFTHPEDDI
mmetsp:Transcript_5612/g.7468  ORF Transcript_5612/g.7468 Transcript_5612/m.7468 type:complete len:84 (+) Transcript_5612:706-957(+)|eukprot:CAMPEP_0185581448 /NCGR_PEP_ID=MMETSP0434-20130131/18319_1 /TAXON_ID=626734 ORGANISM="Favella taraikaensis, Strain Fe Narragansett Bay" /NCGR_SAMPLE_ID=MMETSP0434 /ASSEMBLY_ACC=CAM_ASM_000379 /LENGTH=83 /DNA_ID=CAMNT_0028199985 /DNA_START=701 /DNA_END=952 /DNA_ORIENTATION=+